MFTPERGIRGVAALALLGGLVACTGSGSSRPDSSDHPSTTVRTDGSSSPPSPTSSAASSPSPTSSVSSPPGPTSSAASSAAPSAADGSDYTRCADGRCEVVVRAGVTIGLPTSTRVTQLQVSSVGGGRVVITGRGVGQSNSSRCEGDCDSSSTNGAFHVSAGAGSKVVENGLSLTVERIDADSAVIRISPA